MSIQKRLVSAALCLCVLWGLLPAAAWAVTPGSTQQNEKIYGKSIVAWKDGADMLAALELRQREIAE